LAISNTLFELTKNQDIRMILMGCARGLLLALLLATAHIGPVLAGSDEALVDAIAHAYTPTQISALIASATDEADPHIPTGSLQQLQQLLGVNSAVALALLRVLDRPDIRPEQSTQALAQSAIQFHAVTQQLAGVISEDPEGQHWVTQAQVAMLAGQFSNTEALLRQLEGHELALSGETTLADPLADRSAAGTSPAIQRLIRAAQARTLLGEIALMKSRYGEATDDFRMAQHRLASLPPADPNSAEAAPDKSAPELAAQESEGIAVDRPDPVPAAVTLSQAGAAITAVPAELTEQAARSPVIAAVSPVVSAVSKVPSVSPALSADMLALLLSRGDALLALGDVSSARLLYQRAAAGGDGHAAASVGKTYDPAFLSAIGARGILPDPAAAATWYRRAVGLGDQSAAEPLKRLSLATDR
jgi:TPR repeat protein